MMKTMTATMIMVMVTAVALFTAAPAMAWQASEVHTDKPLSQEAIHLAETGLPVDDVVVPPDEADEGGAPGCEDAGDPDSLNCPGEDSVVPGDDEGIDDGIDDEIQPGDNPGDTPENTPEDDNPDLTPPDDTPGTTETTPSTPSTSSLPKTGTHLLALAGVGMIVALGAFGARVMIARRMK